MTTLVKTLAVVAASTAVAAGSFAQSAKDFRGDSPYVEIKSEPAPRLIVDPPLAEGLALGVLWAQYRVENLRIVPVFGAAVACDRRDRARSRCHERSISDPAHSGPVRPPPAALRASEPGVAAVANDRRKRPRSQRFRYRTAIQHALGRTMRLN